MNTLDNKNPQFYKWGMFYNNPNDSNLVVKKISGLGWTLNFAHKNSYWFIIALVVIVLLGAFLFK